MVPSKVTNTCLIGNSDTMTGCKNGAIRCIEEILGRPLQWAICLLHLNELPLRQVFVTLDGTIKSPDSFSGPIGSGLGGRASGWDVQPNFQRIPNSNFLILLLWRIEYKGGGSKLQNFYELLEFFLP